MRSESELRKRAEKEVQPEEQPGCMAFDMIVRALLDHVPRCLRVQIAYSLNPQMDRLSPRCASRGYVSTHHVLHTFEPSSTRPIVDTARFLTSQEVSQLFNGESLGVPDETLVCMVEFHGNFLVPGPAGKVGTFHQGAEVFDAHTGNLLLVRFCH